jgi:formate hydrogenlyase transcriptional activator
LRQRREDIPLLVRHFVNKFARQMNKALSYIPDEVLEPLQRHDWPGNIRELQNCVERAMILCDGPELRFPMEQQRRSVETEKTAIIRTLAEAERDHITQVLRDADGVVGGRNGAAARLGLARTTLIYRMRKLGIGEASAAVASAS